MNTSSGSVVPLVGRILVSLIFIFSGINKVAGFSMMAGYAAAKGMPAPSLMIAGALTVEILGGLAILTGFQTKLAAWVVFLFLIPTTLMFHNFWAMQGADRMDNMGHFMKNLAIMGGLLFLASFGPGAYSIDNRGAAKA